MSARDPSEVANGPTGRGGPNGLEVRPTDHGVVPGVIFGFGGNVVFYRLDLPLPIGLPERDGTWTAVLGGRATRLGRHAVAGFAPHHIESGEDAVAAAASVPYSVLVQSSSNLRMQTRVGQAHYEPGASVTVSAVLTQFGVPLVEQCSVPGDGGRPDGADAHGGAVPRRRWRPRG